MSDAAWNQIFTDYHIHEHDFDKEPFYLSAEQIKASTKGFTRTADREVRLLCKQDTRESRPTIFKERNLFIISIRNGYYAILQGDGYVDIPDIPGDPIPYSSKLDFIPLSHGRGDSEMQHVDYAFATGLIHEFLKEPTLELLIRGRKYTTPFSFSYQNQTKIHTQSMQVEVDAGYETKDKVILLEAKNFKESRNPQPSNVNIRQFYYPYRHWKTFAEEVAEEEGEERDVILLFFEKRRETYCFWKFEFQNKDDYRSIQLVDSCKYSII